MQHRRHIGPSTCVVLLVFAIVVVLFVSLFAPVRQYLVQRRALEAIAHFTLWVNWDGLTVTALTISAPDLTADREPSFESVKSSVRQLSDLQYLDLKKLPVTSDDLDEILCNHGSLRVLGLRNTKVDNSSISQLKKLPELAVLDISYTNVTDDAVERLAVIESLRTIFVAGTLSDEGVSELSAMRPELLINTRGALDDGMMPTEDLPGGIPSPKVPYKFPP